MLHFSVMHYGFMFEKTSTPRSLPSVQISQLVEKRGNRENTERQNFDS